MTESPYKFLDAYGAGDRDIFFGREQETEVLLADVTLSRLVVVFSRTGTGKTSLINAAVRPELEELGFATFLIRLREGDPVASAREILPRPPGTDADSFSGLVRLTCDEVGDRPVVIFLDQFEEFFLYPLDPERAQAFIADVASIYRDRASAVHLVLSMREDFYVELDVFRDAIPTIFHNDSSLRLRWFDRAQARDAMVLPAAARGVDLDPALVDQVTEDLARRTGRVEPAELQVVCDTLWRTREDGEIPLDRYLALGSGGGGTAAEQILNRRLAEQLERLTDVDDFELLARLLEPGVLSTARGTKYVRDVDGLVRDLDDPRVGRLLSELAAAHLVAMFTRGDQRYVELTHDYLVAEPQRLRELRAHVRGIWPRRVLDQAHAQVREAGLAGAISDELIVVLRRIAEEREDGGSADDGLALSPGDAELLLRVALRRGALVVDAFELARDRGVDVWELLRATIGAQEPPDALNAVDLLGQVGSAEAVEELAALLDSKRFARPAVRALQKADRVEAVETLEGALDRPSLRSLATEALLALAGMPECPEVAVPATTALVRHLSARLEDDRTAPAAVEALAGVESIEAVEALERVHRTGRFAGATEQALARLTESWNVPVAERAERALALRPPERGPEVAPAPPRSAVPAPDADVYWLLAAALTRGEITPFLGPGAAVADRPDHATWELGTYLPNGSELAEVLAARARYPERESRDLVRVAEYVSAILGEAELYRHLHKTFDADYPPTSVHRLLAAVPRLLRSRGVRQQLIVTTSYDDALERAFDEGGEPYDVVFYEAKRSSALGSFVHRGGGGVSGPIVRPNEYDALSLDERPVILKLLGSVDRADSRADSYVVTEDDFIRYFAHGNLAERIPMTLRVALAESHLLFLGYSIRDWPMRMIVEGIFGRRRLDMKSWAVHPFRDDPRFVRLEQRQWADRGDVDVLAADVSDFAAELRRELESDEWVGDTR